MLRYRRRRFTRMGRRKRGSGYGLARRTTYGRSRSYRGRTRRYAKPQFRSRSMKKAVLNTSSVKKRDTMLCYTNQLTNDGNNGVTYQYDSVRMRGNRVYIFPWSPTCRRPDSNVARSDLAAMGTDKPYLVGLAEKLRLTNIQGHTWNWRRIVFRSTNTEYLVFNYPDDVVDVTKPYIGYSTSVGGYARVWNNAISTPSWNDFSEKLFQGTAGVDWLYNELAPIDTRHATVLYDKTTVLKSNNDLGTSRHVNLYHPINKTYVCASDENGDETDYSYFSETNSGCGDIYVVDIFTAPTGDPDAFLRMESTSTLYWHEK